MPLPLRSEPDKRIMPLHPRVISGIAPEIRTGMREVVAGRSRWPLVMLGPAGLGKTSAALCMLDVSRGTAVYETAATLTDTFRWAELGKLSGQQDSPGRLDFGWENSTPTAALLLKRIEVASLVVVDELGCRDKVTDHHYETVKKVIDRRAGKPLVVVSNLAAKALAAVYDDRIVDRLWAGTVIEFAGKSRRLA